MMKIQKTLFLIGLILTVLISCGKAKSSDAASLSLWTDDAPAKKALIEYVASVTDKKSTDYIPVERRIAVFDWDGTLFCETHPTYFDIQLFIHRILDDPSYIPTEEQRAVADNFRNTGYVPPYSAEFERMVASSYTGMLLSDFFDYVRAFMETPQPGYKNLKRRQAYYRPMAQVVRFLQENDFTIYVSTGTDRWTIRPLVVGIFNISMNQIIGSDSLIVASGQGDDDGLAYTFTDGDQIMLAGKNIVKNLQMNKVVTIMREIGVKPVLAFGNSSTDASMINYSIYGNEYKAEGFMLCCDDLEREYGNMGKADKMYKESEKYGWIPVSMKNDWKTIYGDEIEKE